jgi:two-component system, cell cycle sensor histidine kinase and response regulator CckA
MNEPQVASEPHPALPLSINTQKSRALPVILLVEDEEFVREVTADILEYEGYGVFKARNAHEAKTAFDRYGQIVQLLITDVVLPGQNGLDLARELRSASPMLRVFFISGFAENPWTRQERLAGETLYLPKPFSAESLMRMVRQALLDVEKLAI